MKKNYISLILFFIGFSVFSHAQNKGACGMEVADLKKLETKLLKNKASLKGKKSITRFQETVYVPLAIHMISKSTGKGGPSYKQVAGMVCKLNEDYLPMNVQFYVDEYIFKKSDAIYSKPKDAEANLQMNFLRRKNKLNIFVVNAINNTDNSIGVTLGYYDPNDDWMVIIQSETNYSSNTIGHEVGHLFSLLHPFHGYDFIEFLNDYSNNDQMPVDAPFFGVKTENEARTGSCKNCETAGDFLCDTPADYNQGFGWPDCNFTQTIFDPCGEATDVDEANIMSYFLNCGSFHFSEEQQGLILADLQRRQTVNGEERILTDKTPFTGLITEPVVAIQPPFYKDSIVGGEAYVETIQHYGEVYFEWEPVENAELYWFEIDQKKSFSITPEKFLVEGNSFAYVSDLSQDKQYFWRVFPFNQSGGCAPFSETFTFRTGNWAASTKELAEVNSFNIFPNPSIGSQKVHIEIDLKSALSGALVIHDITGKKVSSTSVNFKMGLNKLDLDNDNLNKGVYFVTIQTNEGVYSQKLIIN